MPTEPALVFKGNMPTFEGIQTLIGRPLFDGDTMYPKCLDDYYDWHAELEMRTPGPLDRFVLGYLHGDDENMLLFRRAGWTVEDIWRMVAMVEEHIEDESGVLEWGDLIERIRTGIRRMSLAAPLGPDRAFILGISNLSREQLSETADSIDLPEDYFQTLHPAAPSASWTW